MRNKDCAHSFWSTFCVGVMTTVVATALLAAGGATSQALAAAQDSNPEELWEEFPLDSQRDTPAAAEQRGPDRAGAGTGPPPQVRTTGDLQPPGSDETSTLTIVVAIALFAGGVAAAVMLVVTAIARLTGGVAAAMSHVRHAPRSQRAAAAADPARVADDVVDDLMRVASEALPRREEAKMLTAGPRAGERSETDALKAKSQAGHEPKRPKAQPQSEVDVLIRKPPRDASDVLKAKGEGEGASDLERRAASTTVALMKKLAATQGPTRAAKLREHPTRSPANGGTKRGSALRPVADPALVAARTGARAELQRECEVRWWRGHVKSQFLAVETEADGGEATVASSPSFRWRQSAPPREWPAAAAALRALVEALEREGWTIAGRGEEWFAVRFRIELDVDPTRAAAIHEAGT